MSEKTQSNLDRFYEWCKRIFKHKHRWQGRAQNLYGKILYRVCLKCGAAEEWVGLSDGCFVPCERLEEFDNQFDKHGNFKH